MPLSRISNNQIATDAAISATKLGTMVNANMPTGSVLQVQTTNAKASLGASASTSFVDIGISCSITPSATSSKILIQFQSSYSTSGDLGQRGSFRLLRDSTVINVGDAAGSRTRGIFPSMEVRQTQMSTPVAGCFLDTPSTTSAITYKLQVGAEAGAGNVVVNSTTGADSATHYRGAANLIVMEVAS